MVDHATDIGRASAARSRILDTATNLFYAEGVHAVGIDRIIAEAGVAKATFYKYFPAKDELVRAYIQNQSRQGRAMIDKISARSARDSILAIFDLVADAAAQPGYRGCPFLNAAAEYPDPSHPVRQAIDEHRQWRRDLLRGLLVADGSSDSETTADILTVASDGLLIASHLDRPANLRRLILETVLQILGPLADK
ncbi:TetR/AcrR family transcriptional regulator [Mesorhizobium sp. M7A.F.Ca.MR.362.00.0.0]|uniref:TetR/AcrR family transcriptional regulator n=1 Tax=Mesorhizobium sp. M7A.F.Ca.MR.362.00.0.0 TaxID=2496779 RepID=UPI000FD2DEDE|nr:TetR/AcrR family transcriptional regulator [Mesorhizobium sp. M7A.F.Ca.MR.362.00.0.0]RUU77597.1 TetR/AcrR family transcriptional regulator [Mesorhizobium sp. M7A.F.Ca.MR.362.00.0.0]RWN94930.1 MAG: TetR/AcrR family transcriptional regulator [Mesorhizobium sp.]